MAFDDLITGILSNKLSYLSEIKKLNISFVPIMQ